MDIDEAAAVAERYDRFACDEAPGRSDLYAAWARRVADDPALCAMLARVRPQRRQPPLVFAVARLLGAPETDDLDAWAAWMLGHADELVDETRRRSLQTNEPQRCAVLLPALSRIDGPIALLEVGASGGLCLFPDRYSYRYTHDDGRVLALDPTGGASTVVLECRVRGERMPRVRVPEVVWRAGIDLNPLDPRDPETKRWLTALVWPGESGRTARIEAAVDIAAAEPPLLVAGDAADALRTLAEAAPSGVTLVVTTPGVLAHIPAANRTRVIETARSSGRWITLDAPGLHTGWNGSVDGIRDGFALALDGDVLAAVDPLGHWWEWHDGTRPLGR